MAPNEGAAVPAAQPRSFAFDAESEVEIAVVLRKYPPGRQASAALPLLDLAQRQMARTTGSGWLPLAAMDVVAARLGMPPVRVYELAKFYSMLNLRPIGRYHLQVCTGTSCWLRGSEQVAAVCRKVAGVKGFGETSADGLFTLSGVECLGACVNAPVLKVNDDYYEDLDAESTERLLEALQRGEHPKPGPVNGRQASAPEGGPIALASLSFDKAE
jgi:NADH-quinone oxidoreductase subunit E